MTLSELARRLGVPPGLFSRQMLLMCAFTLLLHAKPSEPHLARDSALQRGSVRLRFPLRQVPYLTGVKGFSNAQVMNDIFPVFTYADFAFVVLAAPASQARFSLRGSVSALSLSRRVARLCACARCHRCVPR